MPNEELKTFINKMRGAGKTDPEIAAELKTAGWGETDVTSALNPQPILTVDSQPTPQPILGQTSQKNVNKLVDWIKTNRNYSAEQLKQSALQGGSSEEDFNAAMNIANAPAATLEYKGVGIRFFALIIDTIIFGILFWIFMKIFSGSYVGSCDSGFNIGSTISINQSKTFYGLCGFSAQLYFLAILAYYVLLEWKLGGTLGKLATGMRVIKSTGESLDLKASLIRNIMRIVDFLPFFYLVGAISVWNSKTKQRVGDRLAKTVVVSKNSIK